MDMDRTVDYVTRNIIIIEREPAVKQRLLFEQGANNGVNTPYRLLYCMPK